MIDPVVEAEREHDRATYMSSHDEYTEAKQLIKTHHQIVDALLRGETVNYNGKSGNLTDRLADQYDLFNAAFNSGDCDYMADYLAGKYTGALAPLNEVFCIEANTLASVLMG